MGQVFLKEKSSALVPFPLKVLAKIWSGFPPPQDQGAQVHLAQFPRHIKTKMSKFDDWAKLGVSSITEHFFLPWQQKIRTVYMTLKYFNIISVLKKNI